MKHIGLLVLLLALLAILLMTIAAPALADGGYIGIYNDVNGIGCEFIDQGGLITMYVIHKFYWGDGVTGCRFRIEPPADATWNYITFSTPFTPVGTADTDITVGYGSCLTTPIVVGTAFWVSIVSSPTCGLIRIKAPVDGALVAWDCTFQEFALPSPGFAVANANVACCCNCWATVPATWGKVKALYR